MNKDSQRFGLIIVDMQNDFVLPGSPTAVDGAYATIPEIVRALEFFRERKWPVFHVVREYREDGSDIESFRYRRFMEQHKCGVPGTRGCEIASELTPLPGEYRIVKNRFSAFMLTELDFMLKRLGIDRIAVCGTQYPNCIRTTVFDGVAYGYAVTVLTDATSARTPEIAAANITDMRNIDVECITVGEFVKAHAPR